jgi:hypothetical protein
MMKISGYKIYKSSGGNKCIQCGTRMHKGLPYLSPVTGKKEPREMKGKSICISCIRELTEVVDRKSDDATDKIERYEQRRFLEHLK